MSRLVLTMIFIVPTVRKNIMQMLGTGTLLTRLKIRAIIM